MRKEDAIRQRLFHYTTQSGLRGIIENRCLWFTNILYLNDATEFEYTFKMVQEELEKVTQPIQSAEEREREMEFAQRITDEGLEMLEKKLLSETTGGKAQMISELATRMRVGKLEGKVELVKKILDVIKRKSESGLKLSEADLEHEFIIMDLQRLSSYERFIALGSDSYVFSFTQEPDDLSQWRAYSNDGGGYCVEFDYDKMMKTAEEEKCTVLTCIYGDGEQRRIMQEIIDKTYGDYKKRYLFLRAMLGVASQYKELQKERFELVDKFVNSLLVFAPIFKHPKFGGEAELRMYATTESRKKLLRFRQGKSMIIPYIEIKIAERGEEMPIRSVLIGPTNHPKLSKMAVEEILMANSIECEVKLSDIPYRGKL